MSTMHSMSSLPCSKHMVNLGFASMMWLVNPCVIAYNVQGQGRSLSRHTAWSTTLVPSVLVCMLWDLRVAVVMLVHEGAIRQQLLCVMVTGYIGH
jgi:hypothetical protein